MFLSVAKSFLNFEPTKNVQTTNCRDSDPTFWSTRLFDLGHVYIASLTFFQDQAAFRAEPLQPPPPPGLFHPFSMRPRKKKKKKNSACRCWKSPKQLDSSGSSRHSAAAAAHLNANQTAGGATPAVSPKITQQIYNTHQILRGLMIRYSSSNSS